MPVSDAWEALIEELVHAIELRESGDPDGVDWSVTTRIRRLERELVELHHVRPGRWLTGEAAAARIGAEDSVRRSPTPTAAAGAAR